MAAINCCFLYLKEFSTFVSNTRDSTMHELEAYVKSRPRPWCQKSFYTSYNMNVLSGCSWPSSAQPQTCMTQDHYRLYKLAPKPQMLMNYICSWWQLKWSDNIVSWSHRRIDMLHKAHAFSFVSPSLLGDFRKMLQQNRRQKNKVVFFSISLH